jgi:hypothetical protein
VIVVAPLPVAVAPSPPPAPAGQGCAAGGHCCERQPLDCQHLKDWLCYRSFRGCCKERGSCGCNCSTPLYVYFLHDCVEGHKQELPPCAAQKEPPHLFCRMLQDARRVGHTCWSSSCSAAPATAGPSCNDGGTQPGVGFGAGHRYGSMPSGHGDGTH